MVCHAPVPVRVVCGFVPWPPVCIGELTRVVPNRFTASHAIAVRKTAVDLQSGQVDFAATLSRMMENWHYLTPTGNSMAARNLRDAREVGTAAEPHLFRAVERLDRVVAVCEVGLLGTTKMPYIAASPDGMVLLRPENEDDDDDECDVAVLEIKTRVSSEAVAQAVEVGNAGRWHTVTLPTDTDTSEAACNARARMKDLFGGNEGHWLQVIHQAAVCDLDTVLYAVGDRSRLLYVVEVTVPGAVREEHLAAVKCVGDEFISWLHRGTPMPAFVPTNLRSVVDSNLALWRAVTGFVERRGVLPPIRNFRVGVAVAYSLPHSGVDLASKCACCAVAVSCDSRVVRLWGVGSFTSVVLQGNRWPSDWRCHSASPSKGVYARYACVVAQRMDRLAVRNKSIGGRCRLRGNSSYHATRP